MVSKGGPQKGKGHLSRKGFVGTAQGKSKGGRDNPVTKAFLRGQKKNLNGKKRLQGRKRKRLQKNKSSASNLWEKSVPSRKEEVKKTYHHQTPGTAANPGP